MSDDIYISGKSTNNKITISTKGTNNNLATQNNNAKYYSDKALESAEKAEQSAEEAKQSAQQAQDSASSILNDEGFIAVSQNIENVNTVANSIDDVNYVANNVEKIEKIVEDLNNLGDTTNINIVATNIDTVNTTANNINSVNNVADSINSVNEIAQNLTEVLNTKTYSENAKNSANNSQTYANNSLTYSNNSSNSADLAQEWAVSSSLVENTDYSSKYYADQAKTSATTATSQATIATNKANEAISALDSTLDYSRITNCLLEVPQKIKLELNNGVLTLKAGSKVIVPNGTSYEEKTASVDCGMQNVPSVDGQYMLFDNGDLASASLRYALVSGCVSGATAPDDTSVCWYNTTDNLIQVYQDDAWIGNRTFPLCIFTVLNGVISSIDQVFNGFGFIGSTWWVDKGVKALISNGYNDDGTINNEIVETTFVHTANVAATNRLICLHKSGKIESIVKDNYFISEEQPNYAAVNSNLWFNPKTLEWKTYNSTSGKWIEKLSLPIAWDNKNSDGQITEYGFYQNKPVRLLSYDDIADKVDKAQAVEACMPDYSAGIEVTLPFTAPTNGVLALSCYKSALGSDYVYINGVSVAGQYNSTVNYYTNIGGEFLLNKGDVVTAGSQWSFAVNKFFPLKGVN